MPKRKKWERDLETVLVKRTRARISEATKPTSSQLDEYMQTAKLIGRNIDADSGKHERLIGFMRGLVSNMEQHGNLLMMAYNYVIQARISLEHGNVPSARNDMRRAIAHIVRYRKQAEESVSEGTPVKFDGQELIQARRNASTMFGQIRRGGDGYGYLDRLIAYASGQALLRTAWQRDMKLAKKWLIAVRDTDDQKAKVAAAEKAFAAFTRAMNRAAKAGALESVQEATYNPRTKSGDGKSKSKGHLAFVGPWEYYVANGEVYRARKNTTYIDSRTGYRSGGRSQGRASQWGPDTYKMHGFSMSQIRQILPDVSFQGGLSGFESVQEGVFFDWYVDHDERASASFPVKAKAIVKVGPLRITYRYYQERHSKKWGAMADIPQNNYGIRPGTVNTGRGFSSDKQAKQSLEELTRKIQAHLRKQGVNA